MEGLFDLTVLVHQLSDPEFSQFIDAIADGTVQETPDEKVSLRLVNVTTNTEHWFHFVYPEINRYQASTTHQTLLNVLNKDFNQFNDQIADRLPNPYIHIYSHDELNESSEVIDFSEIISQPNF